MRFIFIIVSLSFLFCGCKKDPKITPEFPSNVSSTPDFVFKECSLIPEPATGWRDSTSYTEVDFSRAVFNPLNSNEILYVAASQLYNYNRITKSRKKIHNNVASRLIVNSQGWLVFCQIKGEIFKVKVNGDSLQFLNNYGYNPTWDNTGNFIFYNISNDVYKIDKNGLNLDTSKVFPWILGYSKTVNSLISIRFTSKEIFLKNMDNGSENTLFIARDINFYSLTIDNENENFYWFNFGGIFKFNINTLKLDTLLKACPNSSVIPANPNTYLFETNISPNSEKLTFIYKVFTPLRNNIGYTKTHLLEMDLTTRRIVEVNLFE